MQLEVARIVVVDDHDLLALALRALLEPAEDLAFARHAPTVDVLTSGEDPYLVREASRTPALGVVRKSAPPDIILAALRCAARGEQVVSAEWASALDTDPLLAAAELTARERQVLELYASGVGAKSVASALFISENTVNDHLRRIRRIYQELGRAELASLRLLAVGAAVTALVIAGAGLAVSRLRGVPLDAGALAWSVPSLGVIALAGCAAYLLPARPLRGLAGLGALLHLVGLGVGLARAAGSPGTPSIQQWISTASAVAVLAALVAGGLWVLWGLLAASAALTYSTQALNGSLDAHAWANDLQAVLAGVVLGFIGTVTLDLSRKIDANAREVREAARVAAHRRAEFSARRDGAGDQQCPQARGARCAAAGGGARAAGGTAHHGGG